MTSAIRIYSAAKLNLATVFVERCLALCRDGGTASLVLPQNWLSLISYRQLREKLLKTETWHLLARLGTEGVSNTNVGFQRDAVVPEPRKSKRQPRGAFRYVYCTRHDVQLGRIRLPIRP